MLKFGPTCNEVTGRESGMARLQLSAKSGIMLFIRIEAVYVELSQNSSQKYQN
jgi:hypothetical protein